jgi:plastocyanin domain-containing protein
MKRLIISIIFFVAPFSVLSVNAQTRSGRSQSVTINLTTGGYHPPIFRLKRGVPTRLTFIRRTDETCGKQIVIPDYNITRDLPLNKPVTVSFTPTRAGTIGFTCGMNMLRGQIIVR